MEREACFLGVASKFALFSVPVQKIQLAGTRPRIHHNPVNPGKVAQAPRLATPLHSRSLAAQDDMSLH